MGDETTHSFFCENEERGVMSALKTCLVAPKESAEDFIEHIEKNCISPKRKKKAF